MTGGQDPDWPALMAAAQAGWLGTLLTGCLAAFLLQFVHRLKISFVDLAVHPNSVALVVGIVAARPVRTRLLAEPKDIQ